MVQIFNFLYKSLRSLSHHYWFPFLKESTQSSFFYPTYNVVSSSLEDFFFRLNIVLLFFAFWFKQSQGNNFVFILALTNHSALIAKF